MNKNFKKILKKVGVAGVVAVNVLALTLAPVGWFGSVKVAEAAK